MTSINMPKRDTEPAEIVLDVDDVEDGEPMPICRPPLKHAYPEPLDVVTTPPTKTACWCCFHNKEGGGCEYRQDCKLLEDVLEDEQVKIGKENVSPKTAN